MTSDRHGKTPDQGSGLKSLQQNSHCTQPSSMTQPDSLGRTLINHYQGDFPLSNQPFAEVAARLGQSEAAVIASISELLKQSWLSRFGPLYNAERLGGGLVLAALTAPENRYQEVAEQVNALPEVAHNYRREHQLNMWFVLATETPEGIQQAAERIEADSGCKVLLFPKEREYHLGFYLQLGTPGTDEPLVQAKALRAPPLLPAKPLDNMDRLIIQHSQAGLPLAPRPYAAIAESCNTSEEIVLERLQTMLDTGLIRRIGLVPNHYRLGLKANGMSVWNIPDEKLDEVGVILGAMDSISHCYARPRHLPHWPYNLFAMLHGTSRTEVEAEAQAIRNRLGDKVEGMEILFSSAILKKTGMRLL